MITLNLTKEEIERLYNIWQHHWRLSNQDGVDTLNVKISDAFIHRDGDIEPENKYETVLCTGSPSMCISKQETLGWEFVSMAMTNDNEYILLFRK